MKNTEIRSTVIFPNRKDLIKYMAKFKDDRIVTKINKNEKAKFYQILKSKGMTSSKVIRIFISKFIAENES
jgi:hypothetical protein